MLSGAENGGRRGGEGGQQSDQSTLFTIYRRTFSRHQSNTILFIFASVRLRSPAAAAAAVAVASKSASTSSASVNESTWAPVLGLLAIIVANNQSRREHRRCPSGNPVRQLLFLLLRHQPTLPPPLHQRRQLALRQAGRQTQANGHSNSK